jgi:ribosomal protein L16 Arg81 hydroxylase
MREGVTAVLEAVNELSPSVAELTEFLGGQLGARSAANAYISFGKISGFGVHNDDHDVVVLQLEGRKLWQFFRAPTHSGKATVRDATSVSQADHGDEVIVSAGDVMFIPKGTWHNVVALNEKSLHLTVSLVYPTMGDFITWGMQQGCYDVPFEDIRPRGNRDGLVSAGRDFFGSLISQENLETFLSTFHAARASSRVRADFPNLNTPLREDSFRGIAFDTITLSPSSSHQDIEVYALGRVHSLTHAEHALLKELPTVRAIDGNDLAHARGGWDRIAPILESLLDRGLVGKVSHDRRGFVEANSRVVS